MMNQPPEKNPTLGDRSIQCPKCGKVSHHPGDIKNQYCAQCHAFHADLVGQLSFEELWAFVKRGQGAQREVDLILNTTTGKDLQKMVDALVRKVDTNDREVTRLRNLLRSLPKSLGITEKDIAPAQTTI